MSKLQTRREFIRNTGYVAMGIVFSGCEPESARMEHDSGRRPGPWAIPSISISTTMSPIRKAMH